MLSFEFICPLFPYYMQFWQWFLRDLTGMLGGILFTFYQVLGFLNYYDEHRDLTDEASIRFCPFKALWILVLIILCGQHVIVYIHFACLLFHQGSNLDSNAKMWRLVADFMNDLGNVQLKPLNSVIQCPIYLPSSLLSSMTQLLLYSCQVRLFSLPNSVVY